MNLLSNLPQNLPEELTTVLQEANGVRIERIVSAGHKSPEGFWYDQPENEWVMVLKGAARLQFEDTRSCRRSQSSIPMTATRFCGTENRSECR